MTMYVEELDKAIKPLMEFFESIEVEGDVLKMVEDAKEEFSKFADMSKDMNLTILASVIGITEKYGPDEKYKQAYLNWLKLNLLLFATVPYWRSRFGHMIWTFVCASDPAAYYPLAWEEHFDPKQWYLPGEPQRAKDNTKVSAFSLSD